MPAGFSRRFIILYAQVGHVVCWAQISPFQEVDSSQAVPFRRRASGLYMESRFGCSKLALGFSLLGCTFKVVVSGFTSVR